MPASHPTSHPRFRGLGRITVLGLAAWFALHAVPCGALHTRSR